MARYRLLSAHYLAGDEHLLGDAETDEGKGTIVGDGTGHIVQWPTLEMEPLDDEAREMIEKERERLRINDAAMNPIEQIPLTMDQYEKNYVPGLNVRRSEPLKHGAPLKREKVDA
jgi:hypothetical protein